MKKYILKFWITNEEGEHKLIEQAIYCDNPHLIEDTKNSGYLDGASLSESQGR